MAFKNPLVSSLAFAAPAAFTGQLNSNEVYSSIMNMIIGQIVLDEDAATKYDDFEGIFSIEGSEYGDTKLFYDADEAESYPWAGDNDLNVLQTHRPADPVCQEVVMNQFRQTAITLDEYLSKRAWSDSNAFGQMQALFMKRVGEARKDHMAKLLNCYVGTVVSTSTINNVNVTFETGATGKADIEAQNRLNAGAVATAVANLMDELEDSSRAYNEYGFYRAFSRDNLVIAFNTKYANEIRLMDLPTVFHKDALEPKDAKRLLPKYYGKVLDATRKAAISASTPTTTKPIDSDDDTYAPVSGNTVVLRSCYEKVVTVGGTRYHVHSGDEIPAGATIKASGDFEIAEVYEEDPSIICKVIGRKAIPFMKGFAVATEFWNPKALNTNRYFTWGYSELTHLKGLPIISIKKA